MKRENTMMLVGIIIVAVIMICGSFAVKSASGVNPPFTVIESQSMQHSNQSQIGIIDTADMILVKSPEKTDIVSYVEGFADNYSTFGDYGSVIIYKRETGNPVIHRAIIYLEYNESTNYWEAPSLADYGSQGIGSWICDNGLNDYNRLSGSLKIFFKNDYRSVESIVINLTHLTNKAGYITMGDNNSDIDQNSSIFSNKLIEKSNIKSVAWMEIPWIGALKLISKGETAKVENLVPNTIPNLIYFTITVVLIIISIGFVIDEITLLRIKKKAEE